MINVDQLKKIFPGTPTSVLSVYVAPINDAITKYNLVTKLRIAMFLAQIGHESGGLQAVSENLNYSADGLRKIFGKYFPTNKLAADYARKPQMIANRVYAGRMGNGDEASGDGWKYRGRGAIQITGKDNYSTMCYDLKLGSLDNTINWCQTPDGIIGSAGWFWNKRDLNTLADKGDIVGCTKKINGGTNGLDDRKAIYSRALTVL